MSLLRSLLAHPLTRGLDIDSPETTELRCQIIQEKAFLKFIYKEWYQALASTLPDPALGPALELGSGGGFLKQIVPGLLTSEIFYLRSVHTVLDGHALPFTNASLRGIITTNVFHHLSRPRIFLQEATRCLKVGGVITMIEPWVTPWSTWIYQRFHNEPFSPQASEWDFPLSGPLSGANGALTWIIFQRDRQQFKNEFPQLEIQMLRPFMPFRYLLSGGISMHSLMPGWTFGVWRWLEDSIQPWMNEIAMFVHVVVKKLL